MQVTIFGGIKFTTVEANLAINIKPVVSGDDQVTLNIKVDISDFIGNPGPNKPPPTSTSKFESIIRERNEDNFLQFEPLQKLEACTLFVSDITYTPA